MIFPNHMIEHIKPEEQLFESRLKLCTYVEFLDKICAAEVPFSAEEYVQDWNAK